ncbi:Uncharacterised protein [Aerococcus viridans]|nr:Uncharacterised protein [Aerococcus viridans]
MNDFIINGIIQSDFTNEEKIKLATNYLAKNQITEEECKQVLRSFFEFEINEETGEIIEPQDYLDLSDEVISKAKSIKSLSERLDETELIAQMTSLAFSEYVFGSMQGDF